MAEQDGTFSQQQGSAFRVVLIYAVFAALWILLSDKAVETMFADPEQIVRASMVKGWLFVAVTTLLLYVLVKGQLNLLYQSKEKLRSIVRVAPTGIGMVVNRVFTEVNQRLEEITGYSREELIGQSARMLYPSDADYEQVGREKYRQIAEHGTGTVETRFQRKDGTIIDVLLSSTPVDPANLTRGVTFTALDITQRKQAEAGLTQLNADLSATLQAIPDLLFEVDDTGCYIKISATAHKLLAAPVEQLLGHTVQEMLPSDAAQTVMDALANAALVGADYGRTISLPLAAGLHTFELSIARKKGDSGQHLHFIVLSRDITARKVAEEELRQRNEELERFNRVTVGRELDMIELKKQVNALARELGREPPFALSFLEPVAAGEASHEA
jgi:PAS domain S-box-containing protein